MGVFLMVAGPVAALPTILGDLDGDGESTVQDMARLARHLTGTQLLPAPLEPSADLTKGGNINSDDQQALLQLIVTVPPQTSSIVSF